MLITENYTRNRVWQAGKKQNRQPVGAVDQRKTAGMGFWRLKCLVFSAGEV
jgi:hypothetical protein